MKADYSDLSASAVADDFLSLHRQTRVKAAIAAFLIYGIAIYIIFYAGLGEAGNIVTFFTFVFLIYNRAKHYCSKESRRFVKKLQTILYDDINPQKFLEVLNELEKKYPARWSRVFLWTGQGAANYYLPDMDRAYAALHKIKIGEEPKQSLSTVYLLLAGCAHDRGDNQECEKYMELLHKLWQSSKPNTEIHKFLSLTFQSYYISLKRVSDWTVEDKLFLEDCLLAADNRMVNINNHIALAKYEMEHGSIQSAREHLSYVLQCKYPNRFLTTAGQLMAEIEELPI